MRGYITGLTLLALTSCSGIQGARGDRLEIRVENAGAVPLEAVSIGFPQETEEYGAIGVGEASEYREVDTAYRYAAFQVEAGGESFVRTPIDYVGETPLRPGRYTFVLGVDQGLTELTVELRQDE